MSDQHLLGIAEQTLGGGVDTRYASVGCRHQHRACGAIEQSLLQRGLLGIAVSLKALFEQSHDLPTEPYQCAALRFVKLSRLPVDDAESAEVVAVRRGQRRPGIEADVRVAGDQRVITKPRIPLCILDFEEALAFDGIGAERQLSWGFADIEAEAALEPLAMVVDQRDQRDGGAADIGSQLGEIVEGRLVRRVENLVAQQRGESGQLAGRGGCRYRFR